MNISFKALFIDIWEEDEDSSLKACKVQLIQELQPDGHKLRLLREKFPNRFISRRGIGSQDLVIWHLATFFLGHEERKVYANNPASIQDLTDELEELSIRIEVFIYHCKDNSKPF